MSFTPGRIIVAGGTVRRGKRKRVDYLLSYLRDRPLAVVEAKSEYRLPSDGLQQAKEYAEMLDLKFAYSTNGPGIVEHDYTTGLDTSSTHTLRRMSCGDGTAPLAASIPTIRRFARLISTSRDAPRAITRTSRFTERPRRSSRASDASC